MPSLSLVLLLAASGAAEWTPAKQKASDWIDAQEERWQGASTRIWELAELALKEQESARILRDLLVAEGFTMETGVSQMPTAFVAEYGSGRPLVGILAEYDALPGLSQKASVRREPRVAGGGGHGCGHNLFGVASVAAALGVKQAIDAGVAGTVRLYGTPAEEQGLGKIFMVRDGLFDDLDACLAWHPNDANEVNLQPS